MNDTELNNVNMNNTKKIINVLHIITDSNIGGAGRHLLTLIDSIDKESFNIVVILPTGSKLIPELEARSSPYMAVDNISDRSFSYGGYKTLSRLLQKLKSGADLSLFQHAEALHDNTEAPHDNAGTLSFIVHTHASLSGRIAAKVCGFPSVYTRHSVFEPSRRSTRFPIKQIMGYANHRYSNAIIAVSPAAKDNLIKQGTRGDRISVIYNGVPPTRVCSPGEKAAIRQHFGVPEKAFVISQIARLDDIKGHDYTLDAAKACTCNSDIIILIAGSGPMEPHLLKRIDDEKIGNVLMVGFVSEVEDLLNITDLQISASYGSEATSLALLEGMSLGIPAVASDFGGNPYVITHMKNGLLFPQKDGAALARGILEIKNGRELYQHLSEGAKLEYNERFRADTMARNIENLYRKVIGISKGIE